MGFSRQECWSGLPCPSPGDLPNPGTEPESLTSPALAGRFSTTSTTWGAPALIRNKPNSSCVTQTSPPPCQPFLLITQTRNLTIVHFLFSSITKFYRLCLQRIFVSYSVSTLSLLCLFTATISDQIFIPNLLNKLRSSSFWRLQWIHSSLRFLFLKYTIDTSFPYSYHSSVTPCYLQEGLNVRDGVWLHTPHSSLAKLYTVLHWLVSIVIFRSPHPKWSTPSHLTF